MANPVIAIKRSEDNQYYFYVRAANSQIIVTSETYVTKTGAQNGIDALKTALKTATVVDLT